MTADDAIEQIFEVRPRLTRKAIVAAPPFTSECLRTDAIYPVNESEA